MDRLPVVHSQTLDLSWNPPARRLHGATTLQISCSKGDLSIGLHAHRLDITMVEMDKHRAEFHLNKHIHVKDFSDIVKDGSITEDFSGRLANLARHEYDRLLQNEEEPELVINIPEQLQKGGNEDPMLDVSLTIHFSVPPNSCALLYTGQTAHTDCQVRRARAWFPCVDTPTSAHPFIIQISVPPSYTAVAPGVLQKVTQDASMSKKFRFRLREDTPPCHISIVAGIYTVRQGANTDSSGAKRLGSEITHFLPPNMGTSAQLAIIFLPIPLALFEKLLGCQFPFGTLNQVYLDATSDEVQPIASPGLQILPKSCLFTGRSLEQDIEGRLVMVRELARQWFGLFMRPKAPLDTWLLQGLAGWLEGHYVKTYMGKNELAYRRQKEREAVLLMDYGQTAPLYPRGDPYPWGTMHGTENLDHPDLRRWKATAVISMLERRAGEETFLNIVERMVSTACKEGVKDVTKRLIGTRDFLKEVGKHGGFRKDITAFHERWIAGQGCPRITAAFSYLKKKNALEVALQQSGSLAARKSLERAACAALTVKDGAGVAIVDVQVRQDKTNPASTAEMAVNLGCNVLTLQEIKLSTKQQMKRMKRKKRPGEAPDDSGDDEAANPADEPTSNLPVSWLRVDPQGELLASVHILQPEAFWIAQLEYSKDVLAQSAAVAGLCSSKTFSYRSMNALFNCLEDTKHFYYCRLRMEAALALGKTAHLLEDMPAMNKLIGFYTDRCFHPETHKPAQHRFISLPEQLVNQAVIMALGVIRDENDYSPAEIADFLVELLEQNDNSVNAVEDDGFLAVLLRACGSLSVGSQQAFDSIKQQLEHYLAYDISMPSKQKIVGVAALQALASLAAFHPQFDESDSILKILQQHMNQRLPSDLITEATWLVMRLKHADTPQQLISQIGNLAEGTLRSVLMSRLWEELCKGQLLRLDHKIADGALRTETAKEAYKLFAQAEDCPSMRHIAFMTLQKLANKAPSMYKEPRADHPPDGPSMSLETNIKGKARPAPSLMLSGGSFLNDTGGIKVKLRGAPSMVTQGPPRPTASGILRVRVKEKTPQADPVSNPKVTTTQIDKVAAEPSKAFNQEPASKAGKLKVKVLKSQSATLNTQDTAEPKNAETQAGGPSRKRQRDDSATEKVAGQVGTKPKVKVGKGRQEGGGQADAEEKQAVLEDVAAIMSAPTLPKAPRTKKRKTDSMPPPHPPPGSSKSEQPHEKAGPTKSLLVRMGSKAASNNTQGGTPGVQPSTGPDKKADALEVMPPPEGTRKHVNPKTDAVPAQNAMKLSIKLSGSKEPNREGSTKQSAVTQVEKGSSKPSVPRLTVKLGGSSSVQPPNSSHPSTSAPTSQAASLADTVTRRSETPEERLERKRMEKLVKTESRKDETPEEKAARRAEKRSKKDAKRAKRDPGEPSVVS